MTTMLSFFLTRVLKRIVLPSTLLWVTGCNISGDFLEREVLFNGTIKDVNTGKPIENVKVNLYLGFTNGLSDKADSTQTDASGVYWISIRYNPLLTRPSGYLIRTGKVPFYERCVNSSQFLAEHILGEFDYMNVDTEHSNTKDMLMGKTGEIELTASHLQPEKKDTLFISQDLASPLYVHVWCCSGIATEPNKVLLFKYFSHQTNKTKISFRVKKENGASTVSVMEVPIIADSTIAVNVDY